MLLPIALATAAVLDPFPIFSGNCNPTRVHISGRITADAPGKITYTWVRPNYPASRTFTLEFAKPGSQLVTYDMFLHKPEHGWVMLRVVLPEKAESAKVAYQVRCAK